MNGKKDEKDIANIVVQYGIYHRIVRVFVEVFFCFVASSSTITGRSWFH